MLGYATPHALRNRPILKRGLVSFKARAKEFASSLRALVGTLSLFSLITSAISWKSLRVMRYSYWNKLAVVLIRAKTAIITGNIL